MDKSRIVSMLVAATIVGSAATASAQTMDYTSLETMFGEPVTASATGKPQRVADAPVTMEIISADDIKRSAAKDIPGILQQYSGMSVWQWTQNTYDVGVRGYNQAYSPRLLVLVNGRQVYYDLFGATVWSSIPVQLEEIQQIEIVKGPNTALFGFNAASGVINIITYNPLYNDIDEATVTIGTQQHKKGSIVTTMDYKGKAAVRISGSVRDADNFDTDIGATRTQAMIDPDEESLNVDTMFQLTDSSQLRFEASKADVERTEFWPTYSAGAVDYRFQSMKASYDHDTSWGLWKATAYKNWMDMGFIDGHINGAPALAGTDIQNDLGVVKLENLFKYGVDHSFRIAGEYRHTKINGAGVFGGGRLDSDNYSASGMWNWDINNKWHWTNAARIDYLEVEKEGPLNALLVGAGLTNESYDREMTEYSYNSGLVWNATGEDTVRIMTARGIHAPSMVDFGMQMSANGGGVLFAGDPVNIKSAIVTNYELAYDRKLPKWNTNLKSSVFFTKTEDLKAMAARVTGAGPFIIYDDNVGESNAMGLELALDGTIGENWNWDLNYTYEDIDDNLTVNTGAITVAINPENAVEKHMLNAHLGWTDGKWEADLYANMRYKYDVLIPAGAVLNEVEIGSTARFSSRIAYNINDDMTVALSGVNFDSSELQETSGPKTERRVYLSLSSKF